jgi:RNA polymerase-binding transcription factor DksA
MIERIAESYRDTRSDVRDLIPAANEASAINDDNDPHDEGDEALRTQLADLRVSLDEREARVAQLMEDALHRIADGTYGKCVDCGNDIEWSRLKAMPWALRDIDCQEAYEQELQQRPPTM